MPGWMKWIIALLIGVAIILLGFRLSWGPAWILRPFFILNCLVLIVVVLLQSGKAADLAGAFGGAGSQTAFGPRGAANVLSKATTWCAVMFMLCSFAMVLRIDKSVGNSILERVSQPAPTPAPVKTAPAPVTPPASTPASTPGTTPPASTPANTPAPQSTAPAPASSQPASSQPAPPQPKKP